MAGLPEELQKKLSEGSTLTAEEVRLVNEHLSELKKDAEFHKSEAKKAFESRDEVKRKLREKEEEEEKEKQAQLTDIERANKEKDRIAKELEETKAKAAEWEKYREARINELKEKFGESWSDSYSLLPLPDLEKLAEAFTKKPGPGAPPGGGVTFPETWEECLKDPAKMALVEKHPEVKAKLKRAYALNKA